MARVDPKHESGSETNVARRAQSPCVYTTLIGNHERLNEQHVATSSRLPFICLTDNPDLQSDTWQIRHVEPLLGMDQIRSQRVLKLCPQAYLPSFDCSLYIDNSVILKVPPEQLIEQHLGESGFCLPEHSFRERVLDEFLEAEALSLDDHGRIFEQLNHYMIKVPDVLQERPFLTAFMLRDHWDLKVREMLEIWLAHVLRYSRCDQLSVNLAFRRAKLRPDVLRIDNFASWHHSRPHRSNGEEQRVRRLASTFLSLPVARAKEFESRNAALEQQNEALRLENETMQRRCEALETSRAKLALQNQILLSSTSWRIMAPMRAAVGAIRTLKRAAQRALRRDAIMTMDGTAPEPSRRTEGTKFSAAHSSGLAKSDVARFFSEGFTGLVDLFTPAQCELILKHNRLGTSHLPPEWQKGRAATDRFFFSLATHPRLVALLRPLLGEDIILWGASIIERAPGQTHSWHTDIESSATDGRFVSIWVGLENTSQESSLQFISRSHKFGKPVQQEIYERGLRRDKVTNEMITAWARERDSHAAFYQTEIRDGQALLVDGRLWHASHNITKRLRSALLLQYAAPESPIVIPVFNHFEWPFRLTSNAPPSILVSGKDKNGNTVEPPSLCAVSTIVHPGGVLKNSNGLTSYHLLRGRTPILTDMESHISVLSPGYSPHPPHCHVEEELLIVLNGEAEILIAESANPSNARVERLAPGSFIFYPAYQYHTILNSSAYPVTYIMFKWQAPLAAVDHPLQTNIFNIAAEAPKRNSDPISMRILFEAPTAYLDKLHAHFTDLQAGAGYPAHSDEYDVAIVVFSGLIETLGKTVGPGGSIYYSAGENHGMRNVGNEPARYLVFEFHRPGST